MKKIIFLFSFSMINQFLFSQSEIMQFLSMGFNAESRSGSHTSHNRTVYYFYGYEDYSEAFIFGTFIRLSTGTSGTFYPNGSITNRFPPYRYRHYNGQNNSTGYESVVPTIGYYGEEHRFENDRLLYWALTEERRPYTTLERIEQNNQSITIYANDSGGNFQTRYYNIPKTELLDLFLRKYVELICTVNEMINEYNDVNELYDLIIPLLQGRTARELAIFRNCLFAIKGYRFATQTWIDFFYKHLDGYDGRYTNNEIMAMFTDNEKWLLELIIRYENKR
jgi:hypothetical protein